jgi:hypothetical protein
MERARMTVMLLLTIVPFSTAQSNIDPAQRFAWSENIGWTNWRYASDAADGVRVGSHFLAGFIWSENAGWIHVGDGSPDGDCGGRVCYTNLDADDFGVNVDEDGLLHGLAWGENVGWINFDLAPLDEGRARFDVCERRFFGFAWGENIGWINLDHAAMFVGAGPCEFADADCNGIIAPADYVEFQSLFGGPDDVVDCPTFDADADGDVDLEDFALFQAVFGRLIGE